MRIINSFLLFLFIILVNDLNGQSRIYGFVLDTEGNPVPLANIVLENNQPGIAVSGVVTSDSGEYSLYIPSGHIDASASCIGFRSELKSVTLKPGQELRLDFLLKREVEELDEVTVTSDQEKVSPIPKINLKSFESVPVSIDAVEAIIKTLPGVSSHNELSSQYSVRGGNFDENLIYVNDIEIFRPFLIRSGQQEGLSFINSDLVSSVRFSAGGFDASYGDKMSSVLDISYRIPKDPGGSVNVSLLGGSAHLEGTNKAKNFTYVSGIRYKTTRYLLGSLETDGDFQPDFIDLQTYLTWNPSEKTELSFLGNIANNRYNFIPKSRNTDFGTLSIPLNLKIYYQGKEQDRFNTSFGAFTFRYAANKRLNLKLITSGFSSKERETYDILGEYLINELDNSIGSKTYGDSILNIGIGGFLNHGRNYLDSRIYSVNHIGTYKADGRHSLKWGISYQYNFFTDRLSEWEMIDSAGFSSPQNDKEIVLHDLIKSDSSLSNNKWSLFAQDTWAFKSLRSEYFLTYGFRASYIGLNRKLMLSPRLLLYVNPGWKKDFIIHVSTGVYFQPPVFKEYVDPSGNINFDLQPQRSFQVLGGTDYYFKAWERPFRFSMELYYKDLKDLIPYKLDNIRITYAGKNMARGFATGLDLKIHGEFLKDAESWASMSFMRTFEDVKGDGHGYYPRPTDQIMNFGLFFQDYFPDNPDYKVHLYFLYGSRLPYSSPNKDDYHQFYRLPAYKRVDIGFSKILKKEGESASGMFRSFKSIWISAEIFNLLGVHNTVSYLWVQTVPNQQNIPEVFAVPNRLTGRQLNLKLSAKF